MPKLICDTAGAVSFIYTDELRDLLEIGKATVRRVSHVEPVEWGENGIAWVADMTPIKESVVLGPFHTRAEALAAEVDYLNAGGF
jgi:hypothetical protein